MGHTMTDSVLLKDFCGTERAREIWSDENMLAKWLEYWAALAKLKRNLVSFLTAFLPLFAMSKFPTLTSTLCMIRSWNPLIPASPLSGSWKNLPKRPRQMGSLGALPPGSDR